MMTKRSLAQGGEMTTSARDDAPQAPESLTAAGSSGQARPSPATTSRNSRVVMLLIAARIATNMLRSPGFYRALIVAAIGSVALARIGREDQARARQRITAWDARQLERFKQQQERRTGRFARKAERQVRRLERKTRVRIT
jgi:hypothetical protein